APHSPSPHPSFVPVNPQSSRSTSSRRLSGCTARRRVLPLSEKRIPFSLQPFDLEPSDLEPSDLEPSDLEPSRLTAFPPSSLGAVITLSGVAGISRRSNPACRSALMTAGAGPS